MQAYTYHIAWAKKAPFRIDHLQRSKFADDSGEVANEEKAIRPPERNSCSSASLQVIIPK